MTRKSRQDEGGGLDRGEKSYTRPSRGQPGRGGRWRLCRNGSVFSFLECFLPYTFVCPEPVSVTEEIMALHCKKVDAKRFGELFSRTVAVPYNKTRVFWGEFPLCLPRACLGKKLAFMHKRLFNLKDALPHTKVNALHQS